MTRRVGMPADSCGSSSLFRCIHDTVNIAAISVIDSAMPVEDERDLVL